MFLKEKYLKYKNKYVELKRSIHIGGADIASIRSNILDLLSKWYSIYIDILDKSRQHYTYEDSFTPELDELRNIKRFHTYVTHDTGLFTVPRAKFNIRNNIVSIFPKFFVAQLGGLVTYKLNAGDLLETKKFSGNIFPEGGIPLTENVLILGAGPNGVYMATILKAAMPDLNVNIIENRVSEDNLRQLTRHGFLTIKDLFLKLPLNEKTLGYSDPELIKNINELNDIIRTFPSLQYLFENFISPKNENYLNLINFDIVQISFFEYYFAELAQYLGISIFHEKEFDIRKYTNDRTLCIFDATGGRFRRVDEYWDRWRLNNDHVLNSLRTEKKEKNESVLSILHDRIERGETVNLYEGFLPVEFSINTERDIPYISIGDTTIRTNYMNSSGMNFNCFLSVNYVLLLTKIRKTFSKEYNDSLPTNLQKTSEAITLFIKDHAEFEANLPRLLEERRLADEEKEKIKIEEVEQARKQREAEAEKIRAELLVPPEILSLEIKPEHNGDMVKDFLFEAYIYYVKMPPSVFNPPLNFITWNSYFQRIYQNINKKYPDFYEYDYLNDYLKNFVIKNGDSFTLRFTK